MSKRFKKIISTDKFSFFIRYFAVFTLIFGLMTAIIFQLMRSTMYQTSDSTLARIKDAPALVVGFAIARTYEPNSEFIIQDGNIADESDSAESNSDTPNSPKNQKDDQLKLGYNTHV